jgi:S-adenosylmethionine-diacylglycerol 3-amino-3-carboxypropyl transferase
MKLKSRLGDWLSRKWFNLVHHHNLVYNTCWEDPRLDREALQISPNDTIMMITSAGCNALDYALMGPERIFAVDMNPRQNALLELKMAGIRNLDFDTFFEMFGHGVLPEYESVYNLQLRPDLSPSARKFWDRRIKWFSGRGKRNSFYFHGTAGLLAWFINIYIDRMARVRDTIDELLDADSIEQQQEIYHGRLSRVFWTRFIRWAMDRDTTLSFLGVPRAQRHQIEKTYPGGIVKYIEECIETVLTRLPVKDNYFWRVYLKGHYDRTCCPEYLREENFQRLRNGLLDRITVRTSSILDFLHGHEGSISRFVLLDHMDWLSTIHYSVLHRQWQALVDRAAPKTRILWRSGGLHVDYVDPISVNLDGERRRLGEVLTYQTELARQLHARDRVHTYGSFYIADLVKA